VGYLTKPAMRDDLVRVVESLAPRPAARPCRVLIVQLGPEAEGWLPDQLRREGFEPHQVETAEAALEALSSEQFDCAILDPAHPELKGLDLLRTLEERGKRLPSVVVYTQRALTKEETHRLQAYAEASVVKEGASAERLRDVVRLFARRLNEGRGPRPRTPPRVPPSPVRLDARRILVVEDDMRTAFALSATLRSKGAEVLVADTGRAALETLGRDPDIDAVLMDIMMPEMDGYEAMRRIRQNPGLRALPIIALTAKAMKGDDRRSLEAGATAYLPKPVDAERLLGLLDAHLSGGQDDVA
jgi:CheY-like chemotaxis protein